MATPNYELKRGVLLESFGHPEKTCTNDTLTDELAEWHLRQHPEKAIYFARMPAGFLTPIPPAAVIPPPQPQRRTGTQAEPEVIVFPPSKQEDPVRKKLLVDKALELGFVSSPENPIDLIKVEELEVIILNLEKAKLNKDAAKDAKIVKLKDSLKVNKTELIKIAEKFPVVEWEKMNKKDLTDYLFEKLSKEIE